MPPIHNPQAQQMLAQILMGLPLADLQDIHQDILHCSIAASSGGSYKSQLADKRKNSSGKKKKIYAALYKAKPDEIQRMADTVLAVDRLIKTKRNENEKRNPMVIP